MPYDEKKEISEYIRSHKYDDGLFHDEVVSDSPYVDEVLTIDRGVTSYDRTDANLIGFAVYHNLLYPESPDGVMIQQPHHAAGSKLASAVDKNVVVMMFRINTTYPVMDVNGEMRIYGEKAFLRIVPINWAPEENIVEAADGVNWELKPVNLLKMLTKPCKSHRLLTAILFDTGYYNI